METIRTYLDNIFANLPATDAVLKAKRELQTMMEDKYNELIEGGTPEHEAIGIIISEFGNLDEIAESLGLQKVDAEEEAAAAGRRHVTIDEAADFIKARGFNQFMLGFGIAFCTVAIAGIIMADGIGDLFYSETLSKALQAISIVAFFLAVAFGVGLIVLSSARKKEWRYLSTELCYIDRMTEEYVKSELDSAQVAKGITLSTGIVLCSLSVLPCVVFGILFKDTFLSETLGPTLLFVMAALGVLLIVSASGKTGACHKLLDLNSITEIVKDEDGDPVPVRKTATVMDNLDQETTKTVQVLTSEEKEEATKTEKGGDPLLETILGSYWTIVLIIFFIGGFYFHMWGRIWLIWLIAPVVHTYLKKVYGKRK
jgi:hypothetical protein